MSRKLITMVLAAVFALGVTGVTYAADAAKDVKAAATDAAKDVKDAAKDAKDAAADTVNKAKKKVEGC